MRLLNLIAFQVPVVEDLKPLLVCCDQMFCLLFDFLLRHSLELLERCNFDLIINATLLHFTNLLRLTVDSVFKVFDLVLSSCELAKLTVKLDLEFAVLVGHHVKFTFKFDTKLDLFLVIHLMRHVFFL